MMRPLVVKSFVKKEGDRALEIAVSKKNIRRAVGRNLFKRRVRSILRPYLSKNNRKITVIAGPGAENLAFSDIKRFIEENLK